MTYSIEHFLLNNCLVYISLTFPTHLFYYLLKFFSFPTSASNICIDCIKFFYILTLRKLFSMAFLVETNLSLKLFHTDFSNEVAIA